MLQASFDSAKSVNHAIECILSGGQLSCHMKPFDIQGVDTTSADLIYNVP